MHAGKPLDLEGSYKEGEVSFFTRSLREKSRGSRYKLHRERFHLDVRKKYSMVRTTIHWNNLLGDTSESTSPEVFKMRLNRVVEDLIWAHFPMKDWTR